VTEFGFNGKVLVYETKDIYWERKFRKLAHGVQLRSLNVGDFHGATVVGGRRR